MQKNKPAPLAGIILAVLSALLVVGIRTFAAPCGVHDDGSLASCHWAAQAIFGVGLVLAVISLVRIFEMDEGERRGLSFAAALLGVLVACLPGTLIDLCMMQTMQCHTFMQPFAMGIGIAVAVVGAVDLIVRLIRIRKR